MTLPLEKDKPVQPWWNAGRSFHDENDRLFQVSGHTSEAAPTICVFWEADDDGNEGQFSFHVNQARTLARLLLEISDEVDARPGTGKDMR